jgi:hypothetical protein
MKSLMLKNLLLFTGVALTLSSVSLAQSPVVGDWQGTLDAGGTSFHVAWHVVAAKDGSLISTLDNVDQGIFGIKTKATVLRGSDISMDVDDVIQANGQEMNLKGTFEGKLNSDSTELTGTWTQFEPAQPAAPLQMKHVPAQAASAHPQIIGDWGGSLSVMGNQLRLVFHIAAGKDGALTATLDSVDQGANGIPIDAVLLKDSRLTMTVNAVPGTGTYEGTVNKEVSGIDGKWTQGPNPPLDLNLTRAKPQVAAKPGAPSDIDGIWAGLLDAGATILRLNFKIVNMENGLSATLQSPDQSPAWAPANSISREGDKIIITFNALGATFEGKISANKVTIDGTFTQQGHEMPLVIKKS